MTTLALDFDQWRAAYDTLTFEEHQQYNQGLAERFPRQESFNLAACREFFNEASAGSVAEVGGWDGKLAAAILREFPDVQEWVNYDITDVPQQCDDPRYRRVVLDDWPWNLTPRWADTLVASHVFEHMRIREVEQLVSRWDPQRVYMDVPVGDQDPDWRGYHGTHILEVGALELLRRLERLGYMPSRRYPGAGLVASVEARL